MTQVVYQRTSPYYNTRQINEYVPYLDYWQGYYILPNQKDTLMTIDSQYNRRPDLLSYTYYQTPQLWWVFALRNPNVIKDPVWDFTTGKAIYVPAKDTLTRFI